MDKLTLSHLLSFLKDSIDTTVCVYQSNGLTLLSAFNSQEYDKIKDTNYFDAEVKNYTILDKGQIKIVLKKEDK